jgi:imidazolonepropionase-like amidohydrolase
MTLLDLGGTYNLNLGEVQYDLKVSGEAGKPKGSIEIITTGEEVDTTNVSVKIVQHGDLLTLNFNPKDVHYDGMIRLSGNVNLESRIWDGQGQLPDGDWIQWVAVRQDVEPKPEEGKPTKEQTAHVVGSVVYPFMAYGWEEAPKQETVWIRNARIWTCEEEGILENAEILIHEGKIAAVGQSLNIPELFPKQDIRPRVIEAGGKNVTPGIIDEHSHIAISRGVNEGTQASSAEVSIATTVNSEDVNIYRQLAGGVTASQLLHGSANPIGGQSGMIKLRWGHLPDEMLVEDAAPFIKFALGENVKQSNWGDREKVRFPQTRMGVEQVYYDHFIQAREYYKEWVSYRQSLEKLSRRQKKRGELPNAPRRDLEMETLAQILTSERFVTCHSYRQDEINMLMHVADSMGFRLNTFTHILEGYKVADKMAAHGAGGSSFSDWWAYKFEVKDAIPHNGALLWEQGIVTAFNSDDREMARRLNQEAAKAVKYGGVPEEEALKFVTLNPAKLLHLDDQMGSIKVGKDADLVIWSDHPLSIYAQAEKTFVDGICYFSLEQDAILRESIQKERSRLIQLMLESGDEKKQKPKMKEDRHYHCDTIFDEAAE